MRKLVAYLAVLASFALAPVLRADTIAGQFSVTGISVTDTGNGLEFNPDTINIGADNTIQGVSGTFSPQVRREELLLRSTTPTTLLTVRL